jgi:hypothetical protein
MCYNGTILWHSFSEEVVNIHVCIYGIRVMIFVEHHIYVMFGRSLSSGWKMSWSYRPVNSVLGKYHKMVPL